jgi:hypothetical protein
MTLTGKAAEEFMAKIRAEARAKQVATLAAAKQEADRVGKEPFDLAKLETLCDTSHDGRVDPVEVRQAELERKYYVSFPEVMTLAEFAKTVDELNRW